MNNLVKIFFVVCIFITASSCETWLDVDPKTSVKSDDLFEAEEGFKQALTGVYLKISEPTLYGKDGSFMFMDVVSGVYKSSASSIEDSPYYLALDRSYNNDGVRSYINDIWSTSFTAIANINNLIENLESQTMLREDVASVLMGEALGLRAYLHFDMLRMFGPGNLAENPSDLNEIVMPYMTTFNKEVNAQLMVSDIITNLHDDLNKSIELLDKYGPYGTNHDGDWELPNKDGFFDYATSTSYYNTGQHNPRGYRFNYWAAVVTKARLAMWEGEYQTALDLTEEFINNNTIEWVDVVNDLNYYPQSYGRDMTLSREYIFGLDVNRLYRNAGLQQYFNFSTGSYSSNEKNLYLDDSEFKILYEVNQEGAPDVRQLYGFKIQDGNKRFNAKFEAPSMYSFFSDRVCLMRKSEPYYMAAECLLKLNVRKDDAVKYLNRVRLSRQISIDIPGGLSDEEIASEIEREYMKEMIGDGQLFYYFKRMGLTSVPYLGDVTFTSNDFVFPLPLSEEFYGSDL